MKFTESLQTWIDSSLSSPVSFLGNLPPCPYAREALLSKKIEIIESNSGNFENDLLQSLRNFSQNKMSEMKVIAVPDWQNCSVNHVQSVVHQLREIYYQKDLWLLYDHPSLPEVIEGFSFNHGSLLLFMIQKLSHLVRASNDLHQLGYYKNWSKDYYTEVVEHRKKYYEKFLALSSSTSSHP